MAKELEQTIKEHRGALIEAIKEADSMQFVAVGPDGYHRIEYNFEGYEFNTRVLYFGQGGSNNPPPS